MPEGRPLDPDRIAHALMEAGYDWADKNAAYEALEGVTKSILGKLYLQASGTVAERDAEARNDDEYLSHIDAVAAAHHAATRARVKYDTMKVKTELLRTQAANLRAEMNLR